MKTNKFIRPRDKQAPTPVPVKSLFDDKGRVIAQVMSDGTKWACKYDARGNKTHYKCGTYSYIKKFDSDNRMIYRENSAGAKSWFEYNDQGVVIGTRFVNNPRDEGFSWGTFA